jgi:hypothetical protein
VRFLTAFINIILIVTHWITGYRNISKKIIFYTRHRNKCYCRIHPSSIKINVNELTVLLRSSICKFRSQILSLNLNGTLWNHSKLARLPFEFALEHSAISRLLFISVHVAPSSRTAFLKMICFTGTDRFQPVLWTYVYYEKLKVKTFVVCVHDNYIPLLEIGKR